jgi:hypothetical protein
VILVIFHDSDNSNMIANYLAGPALILFSNGLLHCYNSSYQYCLTGKGVSMVEIVHVWYSYWLQSCY